MKKIESNMTLIIIILVFLLVGSGSMSGLRVLQTLSGSYTTGYQGAHMRFAGVDYAGDRYKEGLWDTMFTWDPDGPQGTSDPDQNLPDITGEMTACFVPSETITYGPDWINIDWLRKDAKITNPQKTYEWELETGKDNETAFYRMEKWLCKWYFSISVEPAPDEQPSTGYNPLANPRWSAQDVKVWFEIDLTPIWYFEGSTDAYFCVAEMRLSDIAIGAKIGDGTTHEPDPRCRVKPMSPQSIFPIYYGIFGSESNRADKKVLEYKGKKLNPDLFTDKVYTYFVLDDFGVRSWWDWGHYWAGDTVTVGIDVEVFVIGEWKVQDIQDIPDEYGRDAKTGGKGLGLGGFFLGTSEGRFWLILIGGIIVFLILAVSGGLSAIVLLASQVMGSRKRR